MSALGRVSQLRLSLIVSRLRREIMRVSAAASSSSSSVSSSSASSSLPPSSNEAELIALKKHFSQLDERRRSPASSRLFCGSDETLDARGRQHERRHERRQYLDDFVSEKPLRESTTAPLAVAEVVVVGSQKTNRVDEVGLTDDECDDSDVDFRPDVVSTARDEDILNGFLRGVFDEIRLDAKKGGKSVYKEKAWTTDDIVHPPDRDETVRDRLSLGSIFSEERVDYYQILDKYVAHNLQLHSDLHHHHNHPGLNFLLGESHTAALSELSGATAEPTALSSALTTDSTDLNCPYYLFAAGDMRSPSDGPSKEQLIDVYNSLRSCLPRLLDENLDFSLFSDGVVFVNNWYGNSTTTVGLKSFSCRMALLRALCNITFVKADMRLLKIMLFEEESLVRAHWRIEGTGILFKLSSTTSGAPKSGGACHAFDGIASFYVDHRGKIAKVVVDRVIPDDENVNKKNPVVRMALTALIGGGAILNPDVADAVPAPFLATCAAEGESGNGT